MTIINRAASDASMLLYAYDDADRAALSDHARKAIHNLARAYAFQCGKMGILLPPELQTLVLTMIETAYLDGAATAPRRVQEYACECGARECGE